MEIILLIQQITSTFSPLVISVKNKEFCGCFLLLHFQVLLFMFRLHNELSRPNIKMNRKSQDNFTIHLMIIQNIPLSFLVKMISAIFCYSFRTHRNNIRIAYDGVVNQATINVRDDECNTSFIILIEHTSHENVRACDISFA